MIWKITKIKTLNSPNEGTISIVGFSVSDGVSTIESETKLNYPNIDNFVELKNTTEEQVVGWVKDVLNSNGINQVEFFENMVISKTNEVIPEECPLPWNN